MEILGYSRIYHLARIHFPAGHPYVCWLLKGVYERNPPKPRYTEFWDVNKVFSMFKTWGSNKSLELKYLSFKLVVLLLLVTSQRGQTIINLDVQDMEISDKIVFKMRTLLKHNRVGDPLDTLILTPFLHCKRLCVVTCLKVYLTRTQFFRGYSKLIFSFVKPHKPISRDTCIIHLTPGVVQNFSKAVGV